MIPHADQIESSYHIRDCSESVTIPERSSGKNMPIYAQVLPKHLRPKAVRPKNRVSECGRFYESVNETKEPIYVEALSNYSSPDVIKAKNRFSGCAEYVTIIEDDDEDDEPIYAQILPVEHLSPSEAAKPCDKVRKEHEFKKVKSISINMLAACCIGYSAFDQEYSDTFKPCIDLEKDTSVSQTPKTRTKNNLKLMLPIKLSPKWKRVREMFNESAKGLLSDLA